MFKNYLKIAWRNLLRHKAFSLINIGGLSIGIAVCLLITLYVHHELNYDGWNVNKDRIVRITDIVYTPEADNIVMAPSPALLAPTLKRDYPEVKTAVRFAPGKAVVKVNDKLFNEDNIYKTDANVFEVFPYRFIKGDSEHALTDPHDIVITASIAQKYFGTDDAIGKTIEYNKVPYHVSGILADIPENSDLKINAIVPGDFSKTTKWMDDDFSVYTFVLFKQKPNYNDFAQKLAQIAKHDVQPEFIKMGAVKYHLKFNIEPLKDVHFVSGNLGDTEKGDRQLVYIFSVLAGIILVIALLNYINLSTARATERAKEVGVRKVNGAVQSSLVGQFLFESFFVTILALLIAIGLMFLMLPFLNGLLHTGIWLTGSASSFFIICAIVLSSSLLTGLYPAFVLSAFQPITALKAGFKHKTKGLSLRKIITVTQFVAATVMIAGAFIMNRQINFIQHRSVGYNQNQVLNISLPDDSIALKQVEPFRNALKQLSHVSGVSVQTGLSGGADDGSPKATTFAWANGAKRQLMSNYFSIDESFVPLLKLKLLAGRNLSAAIATDAKQGFIVNEAFVLQMGWKNPIGQKLVGFDHTGRVVGVVNNFNYSSVHNPIAPLILIYQAMKPISVLVKVAPGNLDIVKNTWKTYFPDTPFDFSFLDSKFNTVYQKDITTIKLFNYFTALSVLIACLGLYGLAHLVAVQRTKEIGIRKVLGAALSQLLMLLAKDFVKLVVVAGFIAIPLTLLIMDKWLATYAFHIAVNWWIMVIPVVAMVLISLIVISYQTLKAALSNPVNSLKSE
ncbi:MAG TPA: ABC transporter permease [Mucilaginibacter sp.]|jgi:putative ABC transport system permease protein|nr:ABC transporter permease [Mucilaginibacter sp.]